MTKNIHVLTDESLGGIKREYVEVERKAEVGELAIIVENTCNGNEEGFIGKVSGKDPFGVVFEGGKANWHSDYNALEPTDIVHIDEVTITPREYQGNRYGHFKTEPKRFRLVDRKAEVGERAIYYYGGKSDGIVFDVLSSGVSMVDVDYIDDDGSRISGVDHGAYRVLEPIESETSPKSTDDIIANLARRVAELERREEAQRRLNGVLSQRINTTHRDIETWAQEVEKVRNELDDKIEMCIDDIVTLDERSQPEVKETPKIIVHDFEVSRSYDGITNVDVTFLGTPTADNIAEAIKQVIGGARG